MKRILTILPALCCCLEAAAQEPSLDAFSDAIAHWRKEHKQPYPVYRADQVQQIAGNIVAWQNEDGGWPKNLDVTAALDPDSLRGRIDAKHLRSTLDNRNVYPQIEYLSEAYRLTGDTAWIAAARRGIEYILAAQHPNGGWRGWDADAVTFNDGVIYGVMSTWLEILECKPRYDWIDDALRERIRASWNRGLDLILRTQCGPRRARTVWAQQYDHTTLRPVQARSYELPGLAAAESADIVMLLMRIDRPSTAVVDAVRMAVAWFERSAIQGKRLETVSVPEGLAEDRSIRKDRILVDDPDAGALWARYYDLEDNRPFFSGRSGEKLFDLRDVPAERRTGYTWYGTWGEKVLKKYPEWSEKVGRLPSIRKFSDGINHWNMDNARRFGPYERYDEAQVREIADNLVAWQNADGGWMKNIDWLARLDIGAVRGALPEHKKLSTLDNRNVYPQIEYLSRADALHADARYREAARRGIEYILSLQHANGGWRGADVDAVTFNDDVMTGVLRTWYGIVRGETCYGWLDDDLRERVADSWRRGIDLILRCQYVQHGVRTVWGQQHDHLTLLPTKARSYELPSLTAQESAEVVHMLMDIEHPWPEIIRAVKAAVAWFEQVKIEGVRLRTFSVPEGEREDPKVAVDREVVEDPAAPPIWTRYYQLEDNRPFFCRREGRKVYTFAEINHERRVGYAWYGSWGASVLERYPAWLRAVEPDGE